MSVRAVWILSLQGKQDVRLLFSRIFPTVEKRARDHGGSSYIPAPEVMEFAQAMYESLGHTHSSDEFVPKRDSCIRINQKPVYEVQTPFGTLWPVVAFEQHGLMYCCLPLVEDFPYNAEGTEERPPIVMCPGISAAFTLLLGMAEFMGAVPGTISEDNLKFADLYLYLSEAAPFGTPVNTNPNTTRLHLHGKVSSTVGTPAEKIPAWRPVQHKGKSSLHFSLKEKIRAVQYDNPNIEDALQLYGTVMCHAEVEGVLPEAVVMLEHSAGSSSGSAQLDSLLTHPCVQMVETGSRGEKWFTLTERQEAASDTGGIKITKISFIPPIESFPLCHYTMKYTGEPPIKGFYQMKGESTVEVLVQLKLNEKVKNMFEYCEIQLPFLHRGNILSVDSSPSHGTVLVSPEKKTLVWDIGQRFPSKSLEVLLKASLQFGLSTVEKSFQESHVGSGQSAYAQVLFKVTDVTFSGLDLDPKSVGILPQTKAKISTAAEFQSVNYKIWNSHGDAPMIFRPPEELFVT